MAKNPIAKALRSPHLKQQVVKNKKAYCRKDKHKHKTEGRKDSALWRFWANANFDNVMLTLHYV